mgnify:CR=1 FL=1
MTKLLDAGFAYHIEVVHAIDGRLRLRAPHLRWSSEKSSLLVELLSGFQEIRGARFNAWNGSLVINYEEGVISRSDLISLVRNAIFRVENGLVKTEKSLVHSGLVRRGLSLGIGLLIERFPLLGKLVFAGACLTRGALSCLERLTPPMVQVCLGAGAFALSCLKLPYRLTYPLIIASIVPIAGRAIDGLVRQGKPNVDALDSMAAILMLAHGKPIETSFMTMLIGLGEFIREQTSRKCERIVSDLLGLAGQNAWLVKGRKRICIPAKDVREHDVVVVYPGELIPVDGIVEGGAAAVDQSKLTGEFAPVEVSPGSEVFASTVNVEGKLYVRCTATGAATRAGNVIDALNSAPMSETRIQNYASQIADKMVLPIFAGAALCLLLTRNVVRTMSMLIFDFSTGIRIAAPTAVLASMHRAGRHGILIKSGGALEKLASMDALVFDKTGTLTSGEPQVTRIAVFNGLPEERMLQLASAVEQRLHHPASRAIVRYAQIRGLLIPERVESEFVRGMGVKARVEGLDILVGSKRFMEYESVETGQAAEAERSAVESGESVSYIAVNGKLEAMVGYSDQLRPEAIQAIKSLRRLGVKELVMATGDNLASAEQIAGIAGISSIHANAFPEHKADLVRTLKEKGYTVGVIGDGINDSPALAHADVAISLHGGTDAARHTADLILTDDDLNRLPEAIRIARSAMQLVRENISLAVVPNSTGLALASLGLVGPAGATLLNNGSAICAGLNALRPLISSSWSKAESPDDGRNSVIDVEPIHQKFSSMKTESEVTATSA